MCSLLFSCVCVCVVNLEMEKFVNAIDVKAFTGTIKKYPELYSNDTDKNERIEAWNEVHRQLIAGFEDFSPAEQAELCKFVFIYFIIIRRITTYTIFFTLK